MPEELKSKYVIFSPGAQQIFIDRVIERSGLGASELAPRIGVSGRTVRDWRREKCKMSLGAMKKLAELGHIEIPRGIKVRDRYAHTRVAGALGGNAVIAKYGHVGGDEIRRRAAWRKWWDGTGKDHEHPMLYRRKPIRYPRRSAKLAEFIGILMGDGGISARQVVVTLHSETDKEFAQYYMNLCNELFGTKPHLRKIKKWKAVNLVISRTDLVQWCHGLGLPIGNKLRQGLDIPGWIKESSGYSRACLRGLVDTDGSVFVHRYRVGGKQYEYKKLDFTTMSPALLRSAYAIFYANGMRPYVGQGKKIRLESQKDVKRYFEVIGSSNDKHLRRYLE